ncbi:MAG: glycosyltransferase family 4 protein [Bacteroidota bacterium]
MYPSKEKPYAGIFIKNQYEHLSKNPNLSIDLFFMQRTFTSIVGSIKKYLVFYLRFVPYLFKKFDVIHVHFFSAHFFLAYVYKIVHVRTKVVVTFHGSDYKNFIGSGIGAKIFKAMAMKIDWVIAVGNQELKYINQYINPKNSKVLCAGIEEDKFYPINDCKKEYDFLFIGSFYGIKGVDIFIEAIKLMNDKSLKYCFVGSGEYLDDIKKLQGDYDISLFLNVDHNRLFELYNNAKFLVLTSRSDAFGLVVTEGMYCGLPAIIAPTGGLLDQVIDNQNGFILKENTQEELVIQMKKVILLNDNEYNRLVQNALQSNKQFSLNIVCQELLNIYLSAN